ncbi:hypothetical protein PRIPAC_80998 [Pristionchus pacificus]|uniref:Lipase n=1 Tax=Pristionchus pacificus TaxID=54126 RepID=A0A454XXN6_PRIPA|nr:hypothetical protein PRIPAC_80998 [Pristionchus pacificus]|eukprot:PDM78542.1 lipase [Pristionchus pacificus]
MTGKLLVLSALVAAAGATTSHGPFTEDFVKFLEKNPERNEYTLSAYKEYGTSGTFGGRATKDSKIAQQPVVFVHGNSDSALHHSAMASGWTKSVEHFKAHQYSGAELYGLTYGGRDINHSLQSSITCRNLLGLRRFIEAVLEYTQAEKIDIIAHSMGVTLARKAIKGGTMHLAGESCNLGGPISDKVDALVAISGANYGMCMCLMAGLSETPACGQAGYAPGACGNKNATMTACLEAEATCDGEADHASVLRAVNAVVDEDDNEDDDDEKEAAFVASIWSNDDLILGKDNLVWGRKTSHVAGSDLTHGYAGLDHFQSKDDTVRDQLALVSKHSLHGGRAKRHH